MKSEAKIVIEKKDKRHVVENKCAVPEPFEMTLVRLDLPADDETRYRFQISDGFETRISVSGQPHYQKFKRRKNNGVYVVHRGWIALLFENETGYRVDIAFAHSSRRFYVEVLKNKWYAAYLSQDVVFTLASSFTKTGDVKKYDTQLPEEHEILAMYCEQEGLDLDDVQTLVKHSFTG